MSRGVDQVEIVDLAVARLVGQGRGLRLDGDAALLFQIHGVEHLLGHFAVGQAAAELDEAVGQGGLAVVDVGDDGEIADIFHGTCIKHGDKSRRERCIAMYKKGHESALSR